MCDAQGKPICFALAGGQAADGRQAIPLLDGIEAGAVIADKGYESKRWRYRRLSVIRPSRPPWLSSPFIIGPICRAGCRTTTVAERCPQRLRQDLASGKWDARYGCLRELTELDLGYRLLIAQ